MEFVIHAFSSHEAKKVVSKIAKLSNLIKIIYNNNAISAL